MKAKSHSVVKKRTFHWQVFHTFLLVLLFLIVSNFFIRVFSSKQSENSTQGQTLGGILNNKPVTIVLAGYGGGDHDGANLTDSIMLIRIDPEQKNISYISIPRDIWLTIPTYDETGGAWKINAAYEIGLNDVDYPHKLPQYTGPLGGANMLKAMVTKVTGVPVDYWVGVNFSNFVKFVDLLGGIDVEVEKTFDDPEYPVEGKENDLCGKTENDLPQLLYIAQTQSPTVAFPCRYEHLHFEKGLTHMDGTTALKFVRSRHGITDGSDFGRAARQRRFLLAVKNKILTPANWTKLISLSPKLKGLITTDIDPKMMLSLSPIALELTSYETRSIGISDSGLIIDSTAADGQSILIPKSGVDNWTNVHAYIAHELQSIIPTVEIINATNNPSKGEQAVRRLEAAGITVGLTKTILDTAKTTTHIQASTRRISQSIITKLESEFGVQTTYTENESTTSARIQIILGSDYPASNQ